MGALSDSKGSRQQDRTIIQKVRLIHSHPEIELLLHEMVSAISELVNLETVYPVKCLRVLRTESYKLLEN